MEAAAEACRQGNINQIESLPDNELQRLLGKKDEDGRTLLHAAAAGGNTALFQYLISKGAGSSINTADEEDWTPLHSAVSAGHTEIVQALISGGADVNAANSSGQTALHYAVSKGRIPLIQMLLQAGAKVNAKDSTGSTPLHRACSAGRLDSARALVEGGKAKLESKDASGATPMGVSASCGDQTITLYLLSKGADPEISPKTAFASMPPCLHSKTEEDRIAPSDIITWCPSCVATTADKVEDKEGETPLSMAAKHGKLRDLMVQVATGQLDVDEVL